MMRRSNLIGKQVISINCAISLGYVSQLWVDTSSWVVLVVEVRPNLLSGDFERFPLKEITQVGDVILVEDENVFENDFKFVGLETLVGYTVVTPNCRSIGKVRGYTFNINSGTLEFLELDSFGISIVPSNLVSTYALFVDDILEVASDTIVVHEAVVQHIQWLTKGLCEGKNMSDSINYEEQPDNTDDRNRRHRNLSDRKPRRKRKGSDDWELPMDFF